MLGLRNNYSDSEIIETIKNGDRKAINKVFTSLYEENYPRVESYIIRNSGHISEVADVFQDALIALFKQIKRGSFKEKCAVESYLYAIARNLWLMKLKKNKKKQYLTTVDESLDESLIESLFLPKMSFELFRKKFEQLETEGMKILNYYFYEGLTFPEIQQRLSLGSEQAVRTKKYRCLKQLASLFKEQRITREHFMV